MRQSTQIIQRYAIVERDIVHRVRSIHRDSYLLKETRGSREKTDIDSQ